MPRNSELEAAFDAAIAQVASCARAGMKTGGGEPAAFYLKALERDLKGERGRALERGAVDHEWFQRTVRSLADWMPETELSLIAALGRIIRTGPPITP